MKYCTRLLVFISATALIPCGAVSAEQRSLNCDTGPVKKTYGETPWLVYGCSDNKTIVVISDTGSPAMPFYFTFYVKDGGYRLTGEGTGNKEATAAAFNDLSKMSEPDIRQLLAETLQVNRQIQKPNGMKSP